MGERFRGDARRTVLAAVEMAALLRGDPRIGPEHLLAGAAEVGHPVASRLGITPDRVAEAIDHLDKRALEAVGIEPATLPAGGSPRWRLFRGRHMPFTSAAKQALRRAVEICRAEGHHTVQVDHILAGLALGGPRDPAVRLFRVLGVEPAELDSAIRNAWRRAS